MEDLVTMSKILDFNPCPITIRVTLVNYVTQLI